MPPDSLAGRDTQGSQPAPDDDSVQQGSQTATDPASSSGNEDEDRLSSLDIIEQAIGDEQHEDQQDDSAAKDDEAGADAESEDQGPEGEEKDGKQELTDFSAEELAQEKPRTAERIEQLLKERNESRSRLRELERSSEVYAEKARRYDDIERIRQEAELTSDELSMGFQIMAAMRNDPAKAWEMLQPYIESLQGFVGEALPDDLRQKVEDGLISAEDAKELVSSKSRLAHNEALRQRAAEGAQQRDQQQRLKAAGDWLNDWDRTQAQQDADWQAKQPLVANTLRGLWQQEPPRTQADVEALASKALGLVNEQLKLLAPRRQKPNVDPVTTSPSLKSAPPENMSTMDIINRATGS